MRRRLGTLQGDRETEHRIVNMPCPGAQAFWDLDFASQCLQGGHPFVNKLRKPEAVAALRGLTWFVQHLPGGGALLQEVRSLAGRRIDGLDKPDGVDHARQALQEQIGLRPYTYTAAIRAAGVPQAPPPRPGRTPAHSFVPLTALPRASLQKLASAQAISREAAAAAEALLADSQALTTQDLASGSSEGAAGTGAGGGTALDGSEEAEAAAEELLKDSQMLGTRRDEEEDSLLFSNLGTLTILEDRPGRGRGAEDGGDGAGETLADDGEADGEEDKVSGPNDAPNPVLLGNTTVLAVPQTRGGTAVPQLGGGPGAVPLAGGPGPVPHRGGGFNVHAPAETGPLVVEGATKGRGRNEVDQSQDQGGAQAQDISAGRRRPQRRTVCAAIRRGVFCMDRTCPKEHPARCGDPACFPIWRKDCPLWHVKISSAPNSSQGNDKGAGPGRAGRSQVQGQQGRREQQGRRQQQGRGQRQPQQGQPRGGQQPGRQQQQRGQGLPEGQPVRDWHQPRPQQRQPLPIPSLLHPPRPQQAPWLGWQQQQQQQHQQGPAQDQRWQGLGLSPSYRDVARGGAVTGQLSQVQVQGLLLARLAALEERLAAFTGPCRS